LGIQVSLNQEFVAFADVTWIQFIEEGVDFNRGANDLDEVVTCAEPIRGSYNNQRIGHNAIAVIWIILEAVFESESLSHALSVAHRDGGRQKSSLSKWQR